MKICNASVIFDVFSQENCLKIFKILVENSQVGITPTEITGLMLLVLDGAGPVVAGIGIFTGSIIAIIAGYLCELFDLEKYVKFKPNDNVLKCCCCGDEGIKMKVKMLVIYANGFRALKRLGNLTPNEYEKRYFENKTAYENKTHEITQFFQTL